MKLTNALRAMPDVKFRVAKSQLIDDYYEALIQRTDDEPFMFELAPGVFVDSKEYEENILLEGAFRSKVITPKGAQMLMAWYDNDVFERKVKKKKQPDESLVEYSRLTYEQADPKDKHAYDAYQEKLAKKNRPLDQIDRSEFTFEFLNELFIHRIGFGMGSRQLTIAGIEVTKTVTKHKSNSGKSEDYAVEISWTDDNNEVMTLSRGSKHAGNRRSDPDRNWGLGRS